MENDESPESQNTSNTYNLKTPASRSYTENDKAAYSSMIRREEMSPGKYSESLNFDEQTA